MLNLILFFLYVCYSYPSQAIVSDGIHHNQDYIRFAQERPSFESACSIYDSNSQVMQSGVLIAPNIVATAAHGIASILTKSHTISAATTLVPVQGVTVTFELHGRPESYQVESVLIDSRYLNNVLGVEAKYDIALLKLKDEIRHIKPAKIFDNATVPSKCPLYVVTFGNADQKNNSLSKRAFALYEMDTFFSSPFDDEVLALNRSVLISSIFFEANEKIKKPTINTDEVTARTYEATQNWLANGKKPYGLALPGTSGAPVFATLIANGKQDDYLLGLVTSYAPLSGRFKAPKGQPEHEYLLQNRHKAFGQYQTIFALFYQQDNLPLNSPINTKLYKKDKAFSDMLNQFYGYKSTSYCRPARKNR